MKVLPFLVFALLLAAIEFLYGMNEFWDDTYIGMLYSRNIARGVGPAFVPFSSTDVTTFARVEGYSNPLWVFLTAGMYLLPGSVFFWLKLASFLSVLLLAFASKELLRQLMADPDDVPQWVFLTPLALILLNSFICAYLKSGMESVTFTSMVVFATWHTARLADLPRPRLALINGLLWLAVALLRPEGVLFAFTAGLFVLIVTLSRRSGATWRPTLSLLAVWALPALAGGIAFLIWRHAYYGEWLPNTFYAKVAIRGELQEGWIALFRHGIRYIAKFAFNDMGLTNLVFGFAGILAWYRHLRTSRLLLVVSMMAANFVFVVLVGGDFWSLSRFLQVTASLLAVLASVPIAMVAGRKSMGSWAAVREFQIGAGWALPLALVLALSQTLVPAFGSRAFYGDLPFSSYVRLHETLTVRQGQPAFFLGKWLKEHLPLDAVIGIDQAGQLVYYSERAAIDVLGLSDHHLARNRITYDYLKSRGMTHLVPVVIERQGRSDIIYPSLLADQSFCRDFRLTHLFKGTDQHAEVETFVMFTRTDKLKSSGCNWEGLVLGPDIDRLLQELPVTRLEPSLVRDLQP